VKSFLDFTQFGAPRPGTGKIGRVPTLPLSFTGEWKPWIPTAKQTAQSTALRKSQIPMARSRKKPEPSAGIRLPEQTGMTRRTMRNPQYLIRLSCGRMKKNRLF
jgi:hypothetical protein